MFNYKETMDNLIRKEVESGSVKGAAALVVHKGKEIYHNVFGLADAEQGTPMKRDTIFRLYSMTKPVCAAATMILVERGELDLWDPVSMYLPAYKNQVVWSDTEGEVPVKRESTIFDLLNMTSGIVYPGEDTEPGRRMKAVVDDFVKRREQGEWIDTRAYADAIASVPLMFQPGEKWMYGFSADILGAVIEVATGMKFSDFLRKELFEPLEMVDTGFYAPGEKIHRLAQYYDVINGEFIPHTDHHLGEYWGEDVAFESGGAGLVSTLDDYMHFATMMVQKGEYKGKRILGRKTVEFMTTNHLSKEQLVDFNWYSTLGHGYSCLMRILTDQGAAGTNASLGEHGWDGWAGCYVTMDPKEELVLLYFIQRCGAGMTPVVRKLRTVTYAALED